MATLQASPKDAEALRAFRVRDAMHTGVITCTPDTPLEEVARLMAVHRVHAIVVGEDTAPWGVVSDLDLVSMLAGSDESFTAAGAAATDALPIAPDDTLEHAAQLIREHAVAHVIVVDPESERPVGVVSTLDIAAVFAGIRPPHGNSAMRVENVMTRRRRSP